jgi:ribulose-phosphate 3-epimerase
LRRDWDEMAARKAFELLRSCRPTVSVGVLTADLMHLENDLALLDRTEVVAVHFDVMDGCFCPMMTVGPPFIKGVKTKLLKDVHLMIRDPLDKVEDFVSAGADIVTVHVESCDDLRPVLERLAELDNANDSERGVVRGVALNPGTPLESLEPLLGDLEMISVLGVEPGLKGQAFIAETGERFLKAREMASGIGREVLLCIDGGVKLGNIEEIAALGPDVVVSGSAIYDGRSPLENARAMMSAVKSACARASGESGGEQTRKRS